MIDPQNTSAETQHLSPSVLAMIHQSAVKKVGVPILFSGLDVVDLFETSEEAAKRAAPAQDLSGPVDLNNIPMDDKVRKLMSRSDKTTAFQHQEHPLVSAFAVLSYASQLGREIKAFATPLNQDGSVTQAGPKATYDLDPAFFSEFQGRPVTGAKALFGSVTKDIGLHQRMMVIGFISPNPTLS